MLKPGLKARVSIEQSLQALKEGVLIIGASDYLEGICAEKMVFQKYG
jgi:hypothetical protein